MTDNSLGTTIKGNFLTDNSLGTTINGKLMTDNSLGTTINGNFLTDNSLGTTINGKLMTDNSLGTTSSDNPILYLDHSTDCDKMPALAYIRCCRPRFTEAIRISKSLRNVNHEDSYKLCKV